MFLFFYNTFIINYNLQGTFLKHLLLIPAILFSSQLFGATPIPEPIEKMGICTMEYHLVCGSKEVDMPNIRTTAYYFKEFGNNCMLKTAEYTKVRDGKCLKRELNNVIP